MIKNKNKLLIRIDQMRGKMSEKEVVDGGHREYFFESSEPIEASDTYHTFDELYEHRYRLYITVAQYAIIGHGEGYVWRAKRHHDGSSFDGYFILGIGLLPGQQITYHLPLRFWEEMSGAEELEHAPEWDGHTAEDVLDRLKTLG